MIKLIGFIFTSVLVSLSYAARPYSDAGCGLGTMVMGKNGNQILAATTNGTSGSQTFGISSGTSNCVDGGVVRSGAEVPLFLELNREALAKESARGEGETVTNLAELMNCSAQELGSALQQDHSQIFSNQNTGKMQEAISNSIASRLVSCGA